MTSEQKTNESQTPTTNKAAKGSPESSVQCTEGNVLITPETVYAHLPTAKHPALACPPN